MTCRGYCKNDTIAGIEISHLGRFLPDENFRNCNRCFTPIFYNAESKICPCCGFVVKTWRKFSDCKTSKRVGKRI